MAISNILPRKIMRNRTRQQSMADRHDYDQKAEKTQDGELVSSFMCSPETAAEEFELSKRLYFQITGRSQPVHRDVIMYRVIQSFKPGEVSPEEANRIGYELAMKLTEGKHQFVVSTHVDKAHIHTHIEFNSTNLNCDGKFVNPKDSYLVLRRLNDDLCRAHGLSVIENPKPSTKERKQKEMEAVRHGRSHKEHLRQTIDRVLPDCRDYDDFLARMRAEGYEIKEGKALSFRAPGWDRFTRSNKLGADYTREALRERSAHRGGRSAEAKKAVPHAGRKVNMLIDIQAKLAAGKGAGYERWAKIFNLKEAAKTLNFLVENDLTDYDELAARAEQAGDRFDEVPDLPALQSKYHIRGAFKKALSLFPAHAAPAMLQADKLLLHFPAAVRTNLVAAALLPGRGRSFLFGRRVLWNPMLLDAGFISGQFGEERPVYLVIGNPYRKRFYLIVDSGGDLFSSFIPRHFPVFLVMLTDGPEHPF